MHEELLKSSVRDKTSRQNPIVHTNLSMESEDAPIDNDLINDQYEEDDYNLL